MDPHKNRIRLPIRAVTMMVINYSLIFFFFFRRCCIITRLKLVYLLSLHIRLCIPSLCTERQSDQEVLIPFTSAVGRDAVQETEEQEDTTQGFPSNNPSSQKPVARQEPGKHVGSRSNPINNYY